MNKHSNNSSKHKDTIYAKPLKHIEDFKFDKKVAAVFTDMIQRSVPGYESIIPMMGMLANHFVKPGTRCYDLGSSLGATSLSILSGLSNRKECTLFAIDNSLAMINECKALFRGSIDSPVRLICSDIRNIRVRDASLVALNFTLQFIPPDDRDTLLAGIHNGLVEGGALVLSEKIKLSSSDLQQCHDELHYAYKKYHGYSDLEISQKRTALENMMKPETVEQHQRRLSRVGFSRSFVWFQCLNFISLIAIK